MTAADGDHQDQLSFDKLNSIVLREDADIRHTVIFVDSQCTARDPWALGE